MFELDIDFPVVNMCLDPQVIHMLTGQTIGHVTKVKLHF